MGPGGGTVGLVLGAGAVAKAILSILFCFSIVSWAIIGEKLLLLRRIRRESEEFLSVFEHTADLSAARRTYTGSYGTPLYRLFQMGYRWREGRSSSPGEDEETLRNALDLAASTELSNIERRLSFLATTASVSPFFGLLGTVWGVMRSFISIGERGSASIGVVAPGIAEALITTVVGLGAAIPAVIAYNYLVGRTERVRTEMERFSFDLIRALRRKADE